MNGQGLKLRTPGLEKKVAENQFYPTTPECIEALMYSGFGPSQDAAIWEPSAGEGHISLELERFGCKTVNSDIKDYGVLEEVELKSFLDYNELRAPQIVTNPPYESKGKLTERYIMHALSLNPGYMALLLKADYLNKKSSLPIFEYKMPDGSIRRPSAILPLTWRPDFHGKGKPFLTVTWYVWDTNYASYPVTKLLARP